MTAVCDTIMVSAAKLWSCKETENGARIRTTCVFPSFEPVFVYVVKFGDGFVVHDAGETMGVILSHGGDGTAAQRIIKAECKRYDLKCEGRRISLKIDAIEWLETAIVSVANTAAVAARQALAEGRKKAEKDLGDILYQLLEPKVARGTLVKNFDFHGASGRKYHFDLAVQGRERLTLIQTVLPNANSLNSKFVALSDVPTDEPIRKIAAHGGDLSIEDILLLQTVATVARPEGVVEMVTGSQARH